MKRTNTASKGLVIKSTEPYKLVIIGAGNVAFHISRHLYLAGHQIACVWSRTLESALRVAAVSGSVAVSSPDEVPVDADFYLLAVSDSAIADVAARFRRGHGIWIHTAGAVPMDVLGGDGEYGVFYPLQTLSTQRQVSMDDTPLMVEGSSQGVLEEIRALASSISGRVVDIDSAGRLRVHLAAVFANNFSNHMATIAFRLLAEYEDDFSLLEPILRETFLKMTDTGPAGAQTGPALRGDMETMKKHLELLKGHPEWEKLYTFVSRDIEHSRKSTIDPRRGDDQL
ncbi:MAG: DUF2520 domain-containing protein [Bacteroidetes bacterium]|nr:DUF2520 domain-containing protein [Bacteroidota bacterium]